jgi:hypothetical protein
MNKDAKIVKRRGVTLRRAFSNYLMFIWNIFASGAQKITVWSTYHLGFKLMVLVGNNFLI